MEFACVRVRVRADVSGQLEYINSGDHVIMYRVLKPPRVRDMPRSADLRT